MQWAQKNLCNDVYVIGDSLSLFALDDGSVLTISALDFRLFNLQRERSHTSACIHMLFNTENISSSCQEACQCRRDIRPTVMVILSLDDKTFGKTVG